MPYERILMKHVGLPHSTALETYRADGGYDGAARALRMKPEELVDLVKQANLRGRGGAGFPAGVKWSFLPVGRDVTYLCVNADESEPPTFCNRVLIENDPHLLLEGILIAGYATQTTVAYVYMRGEFMEQFHILQKALDEAYAAGYFGQNILGSGYSLECYIHRGAGAYVCGEETGLIESLEGKRGWPRIKPPFPAVEGLFRKPTVVNNVETLASVAAIFARGAAWFRSMGSERSSGFKLFSISGDCERPGVYEFPFGITVAELLQKVGGAGAKAVQVGGASGTCVPAADFGRRIAFEDLGTGGSIIVFGPGRDMLHVARNFMEFFVEESCGQCTPCRVGNAKLLEGIEQLEQGTCSNAYLRQLLALCETMQIASKCGLGQSSPNAFVSIVNSFPEEILGRTPVLAGGER